MANNEPRGAVHWIDHHVVGTNNIVKWMDWATNVTGLTCWPIAGVSTEERKKNAPIRCFQWFGNGSCRIGTFVQPEIFPQSKGLGKDMPRCGFFIRTEDIDTHLGRLKQHGIPHSDPVRISNEGDEGTTIHFEDPDGNQYEFWAPVHMPEGAMAVATPHNVGRISHVVFGSRNLEKTAAFFREYCGLRQIDSPEIPQETLVLRLLGGARLVYKLADSVDERVTGHGSWWDVHTALTVRDEEFFPNYRRMWDGLPEEEGAKENMSLSLAEEDALPPRTGLHRSIWGYMWKERYKRGDEFYDWDGHAFHFSGGLSETADGSLTVYRTKDPDSYLRELTEKVETGALA